MVGCRFWCKRQKGRCAEFSPKARSNRSGNLPVRSNRANCSCGPPVAFCGALWPGGHRLWPDQIRNHNDPSTFPKWHFVDYPLIAPSFPDRGSPTPQDDILFGIGQSEAILRSPNATAQDKGLAQQRYVKSHRILANCRAVKDFRRFRNSQTGLGLVGQFWGLDSDRILKLILREIILSQEIQMPPGGRRPMGHRPKASPTHRFS